MSPTKEEGPSSSHDPIPSSILIIGAGVFGLSTAYTLSTHPSFAKTRITVVDRCSFPAPDASSIDTNRIIRPDYADPAYAALAQTAQNLWRNSEWGADGRYNESGLCLTAEAGREDYVLKSLANVRALNAQQRNANATDKAIRVLRSRDEILEVSGTGGASGTTGYLNPSSGWADAEAGMRYLHSLVASTHRVSFVTARVTRLLINHSPSPSPSASTVTGALLSTGETLTADLTLVACGAWTPSLLDLRGIASATGQVLAYLPLSAHEQHRLGAGPVQLNMSTGLFVMPPRDRVLHVARHGYGYVNPVAIPHPEDPEAGEIVVSLPRTKLDDPELWIPREGEEACRQALRESVPSVAHRPFAYSRICWYTDTPTGDFLISYHPRYGRSLFVATGGSGHGFKFMPVIGDKIVECILGRTPEEFREKWAWPKERLDEGLWTGDGSRGGRKGMVLDEELKRDRGSKL